MALIEHVQEKFRGGEVNGVLGVVELHFWCTGLRQNGESIGVEEIARRFRGQIHRE